MRKEDSESAHEFKSFIAQAIAGYQIRHNLPVDNLRNWYTACRWFDDYFDLATFKIGRE